MKCTFIGSHKSALMNTLRHNSRVILDRVHYEYIELIINAHVTPTANMILADISSYNPAFCMHRTL